MHHTHVWGEGTPVVLVHGSGSSGTVFEGLFQVPGYRFLAPDRHGYGARPSDERGDFDADAADVADLLGDGAHLVGSSYGGLVALLAAARRPGAVRSLAVNEPPAFSVARGHPPVDAVARRLAHVYAAMGSATPEEFDVAFNVAYGFPPSTPTAMDEQTRKNVRAMMAERLPNEAEIPVATLAAAPFPKLVISGGWSNAFETYATVLPGGCTATASSYRRPGTVSSARGGRSLRDWSRCGEKATLHFPALTMSVHDEWPT